MIIHNMVKCKKCNEIIESKHRHDFVWCSCQSVAVDGGRDYLKRTGNLEDMVELSEVYDDDELLAATKTRKRKK